MKHKSDVGISARILWATNLGLVWTMYTHTITSTDWQFVQDVPSVAQSQLGLASAPHDP